MNHTRRNPKTSDQRAFPIALVCLCLTALPASAHEFWLDPESSVATPGQSLSIGMRVGQDLVGQALPYLDTVVREMKHWPSGTSSQVNARLGDRPAMQDVALKQPGLHRFTVDTNPAYIVFDTLPEFTEYLEYEGLDDIAERHMDRQLPKVDIAESYIRNARTLVQVGPVAPDHLDAPTGMPFEIVVEGNPFAADQSEIDLKLTWQGKPAPDTQIAVFHKPDGVKDLPPATRTLVTTNGEGVATLDLSIAGQYLLNAVRMDPVQGPGSVVWQSHWASLTFHLPAP
ncbi:MAG: DUF4198 domain-containing protein [Boseongicola sp.]|nr:DUF4198 domain-containing protein [Boseongicola sp.]